MDEFFKAILALGALFGIYKVINDVLFSRTKRHREDYEFTKTYIEDLHAENTHNFVIEKGFRALTDELYSIDEIKALLSYPEPTKAIQLRANSKNFLEFSPSTQCYKWNGQWSNECIRTITNTLFIALYYVFAFIPIYTLIMSVLGTESQYEISKTVSITFAIIAILGAIKHIELSDAISFMNISEQGPNGNVD